MFGAVKRAVDDDPRPGRFIITGSSQADLTAPGWPGTGRLVRIPMFGLVGRELAGSAAGLSIIDRLAAGEGLGLPVPADVPDLRGYVAAALRGGFTEAALSGSERARSRWLSSYVDQVVTRDLAQVARSGIRCVYGVTCTPSPRTPQASSCTRPCSMLRASTGARRPGSTRCCSRCSSPTWCRPTRRTGSTARPTPEALRGGRTTGLRGRANWSGVRRVLQCMVGSGLVDMTSGRFSRSRWRASVLRPRGDGDEDSDVGPFVVPADLSCSALVTTRPARSMDSRISYMVWSGLGDDGAEPLDADRVGLGPAALARVEAVDGAELVTSLRSWWPPPLR